MNYNGHGPCKEKQVSYNCLYANQMPMNIHIREDNKNEIFVLNSKTMNNMFIFIYTQVQIVDDYFFYKISIFYSCNFSKTVKEEIIIQHFDQMFEILQLFFSCVGRFNWFSTVKKRKKGYQNGQVYRFKMK